MNSAFGMIGSPQKLLDRPPHGVAVAFAHPVTNVDEIEMGIDLHDVDGAMLAEGTYAGDIYGMVAAEHHRQRSARQNPADGKFGVAMAPAGIGMHNVDVADVDHAHFVHFQISRVVLMVVRPGMTERKQGRGFTDRARSKARSRAVLRTHVIGDAENGDIRIDPLPVRADRALAEGAVADEGKIEAAGVVGVLRHHPCGFQPGGSPADRRVRPVPAPVAVRV